MAEERRKLSDRVYESIKQRIDSGEWPEGTRLPTETELAVEQGVSRPVIREALITMRSEGVIGSKRGSGSIVLAGSTPVTGAYRPIENIADLINAFEFRLTVECNAAALAASRATDEQLAAIQKAHHAIADNISDDEFGDLDLEFHLAIAQATGNQMYQATLNMLGSQIVFGMRLTGKFAASEVESRIEVVRGEHENIVNAITARDPKAAYAAMKAHLTNSQYRILGFKSSAIGPFE